MTRRVSRFKAVLAAALLVFGNARGLLGHVPCARHDGAQGHAGHTAAPAQHQHQHHAAASTSHDESKPAQEKGPCTCLDHCSSCQAIAAASVTVPNFETPVVLTSRLTSPERRVPVRVSHQLPFATAPPAIA